MEKGEIAQNMSNFTFFHNVFIKLFFFSVLKYVYMEGRVKIGLGAKNLGEKWKILPLLTSLEVLV